MNRPPALYSDWRARAFRHGAFVLWLGLSLAVSLPAELLVSDPETETILPGDTLLSEDCQTWEHRDLDVGAVYAITFDPDDTDIIYIGTYQFLWKSVDRAASWSVHPWESSPTNPYTDPISIAVDPKNTETIYVGGNGSHAFKSIDGGMNWAESSSGLPIDSGITWSMIVDPVDTSNIYLCIGAIELEGQGGVYKSTDSGATWVESNTGLPYTNAWSLAMDPGNPNVLFAGSVGIHKSIDAGATWAEVLAGYVAKDIVIDPSGVIYSGMFFGGGVHRSDDNGATWTPSSSGLPADPTIWSLAIDPSDPSVVYAGTENDGVYKTIDSGASWLSVNVGMEAADSRTIWSLAVDPDRPSIVYAGTIGGGLYQSIDAGATWVKRQSDTLITAFEVNPQNPSDIVAALAGSGLARTADGGQTWEHLAGEAYITDMFSMAMDPTDADTLFAGSSAGEGIYTSSDGGMTWSLANTGLAIEQFANVWTIEIDPSNPLTMYAGADNESGVFKSIDGGQSWSPASTGLAEKSIFVIAIDPADSRMLYAGTASSSIYKSVDSGNGWFSVSDGITEGVVKAIAFDPNDSSILYAGLLGGGLYKSTNAGASWTRKKTGMDNTYVSSVLVDPLNPSIIYAGTGLLDPSDSIPNNGNGVYISSDAGETWAEMGSGLSNNKVFALAMAPAPRRGVLAGTAGSGIDFLRSCGDGGGGGQPCQADATTLCIDGESMGDGRFAIEVDFQTAQGGGASGAGRALTLESLGVRQGGLFWFFDPVNPEMLIKVIDGCAVNGHFWVFHAAGTNVGMTVRVTDTSNGTEWTDVNPDLQQAAPVADTEAFPCESGE